MSDRSKLLHPVAWLEIQQAHLDHLSLLPCTIKMW